MNRLSCSILFMIAASAHAAQPIGFNRDVRAIVSGDLAKSEVWQRIISDDMDDVMPPPKSHKTLNAAEKEVLKRWIEEGAKYQRHWAFEAPQRAALPVVKDKAWVRNPVDAFVLAGLEAKGLKPAQEADGRAAVG